MLRKYRQPHPGRFSTLVHGGVRTIDSGLLCAQVAHAQTDNLPPATTTNIEYTNRSKSKTISNPFLNTHFDDDKKATEKGTTI